MYYTSQKRNHGLGEISHIHQKKKKKVELQLYCGK